MVIGRSTPPNGPIDHNQLLVTKKTNVKDSQQKFFTGIEPQTETTSVDSNAEKHN